MSNRLMYMTFEVSHVHEEGSNTYKMNSAELKEAYAGVPLKWSNSNKCYYTPDEVFPTLIRGERWAIEEVLHLKVER